MYFDTRSLRFGAMIDNIFGGHMEGSGQARGMNVLEGVMNPRRRNMEGRLPSNGGKKKCVS